MESDIYDVALSFAGEDRTYVEKVALFLRENSISVFYDNFEEEKLWGQDLVKYLQDIYAHKCVFCVIFISKYYIQKPWTNYESAIAMERMLECSAKNTEYILPVQFDDSKMPGILNTRGVINALEKSPEQLGELIIKKIENHKKQKKEMTFDELKQTFYEKYKTISNERITVNTVENELLIIQSPTALMWFKISFLESEKIIIIYKIIQNSFAETEIPSLKIMLSASKDNIINTAVFYNLDFFHTFVKKIVLPEEIASIVFRYMMEVYLT